ncbi:MAG TPA: hypothetical protein VG347_09395 [Verrucomicrobiae bacterium]|nr:hypothetical protein [Verrucomicrobiae bacterium]
MIDQHKKKALIKYIKQRQMSECSEILLSPDLYFDGYDDGNCNICANNRNPISTSQFAARLRKLQEQTEVSAVFIRFYDYTDAEESEDCWIGSDSVCLVTKVSLDMVREWFADFEISNVQVENDVSKFDGAPAILDGFHLVAVWWD